MKFLPPPDEEQVYAYIWSYARNPVAGWPTSKVFYELLINRQVVNWQRHRHVIEALDRIVLGQDFVGEKGLLFLNRCVHTAINPLHLDSKRHPDLRKLVNSLREIPEKGENRATRKIRQALKSYTKDKKFECVLRQVRLTKAFEVEETPILGDLFHEYSFLYLPGGTSEDIENVKAFDLADPTDSHYELTYGLQYRKRQRVYAIRTGLNEFHDHCVRRTVKPEHNPTRLSQKELREALFLYNTRRPNNFRERGEAFYNRHQLDVSFDQCRDEVLAYMVQPLQGQATLQTNALGYYKEIFYRALQEMQQVRGYMQSTIIQTFKRILATLLPGDVSQAGEQRFLQRRIEGVKPINFAALLLNLVLGCPMVLYDLEKRLTALFISYEQQDVNTVSWLIKFFEYMHIALTMNYRYLRSHRLDDEGLIPPSIIL